MKKLFIVTLAVLFIASAAYAVETDFSGMLNTRGTYYSNASGFEDSAYAYMEYDMEFDADLKIMPSDSSLIFLNFEIHDELFDDTPQDSQTKTGDDQIAIKRAYGKHTFGNGVSTQFGLMTGGAFGTAFTDTADGAYRWRVDGKASFGAWGVILEKGNEIGSSGDDTYDAEADDTDAYFAYWYAKFGNIVPGVLLGYRQYGDLTGAGGGLEPEGSDMDLSLIHVFVKGSTGAIGFEGEFNYHSFSANWDSPASDSWSTMGAYVNAWMGLDAANVGAYVAYGSWDDEGGVAGTGAGHNFGADFYFGEGIGESQSFGTGNNGGFAAVTLLGLYGDFAASDALSFSGNFSYWMSNETDTAFEDGGGNELTGRLKYKLSDNATYSVGVAFGQITMDAGDPDPYSRAFHKIQINF